MQLTIGTQNYELSSEALLGNKLDEKVPAVSAFVGAFTCLASLEVLFEAAVCAVRSNERVILTTKRGVPLEITLAH